MNCLDCDPLPRDAVAACSMCGAGVCREHIVVSARHLTRVVALMREVPVEPAARIVRCRLCQAATDAASGKGAAAERR